MIAALPMYDRPETAAAHDALWSAIRDAHGGDLPSDLDRRASVEEALAHSRLVLGQVCGLPYRSGLHARLTLVGTADYGLPDVPPGYFYSVLVVRRTDTRRKLAGFADAVLAVNAGDSQSGWAAPQSAAARAGFQFRRALATGAHSASARAVAQGRADMAAIDAVSWRAIRRFDDPPLRVLGRTPESPGLLFVAAPGQDAARMLRAIGAAIDALTARQRATLGMRGVVSIPTRAYMAAPMPPPFPVCGPVDQT